MTEQAPETLQHPERSSVFSIASVISLVVGLAGAAVSLYIFYASKERPALDVEQLPSLTYASIRALSGLGNVELLIDGQPVADLRAIPFSIRNVGNAPVSSLDQSSPYNLVGPVVVELSPQAPQSGSQVLAVQLEQGSGSPLNVDFTNFPDRTEVEISIRNLNVDESSGFTILYVGDKEPTTRLLGNPLLGGSLTLIRDARAVLAESWWGRFKAVWLARGLGILFLSQFPMVAITLAVGARRLRLEQKQNEEGGFFGSNPRKQEAESEQSEKMDAEIDEKLTVLEDELTRKMQTSQVPVPMGPLENTQASVTVYDLFRENYRSKWDWILREKYPLPREFDRFARGNKLVITPWIGWGDFLTSALLPFGIGSTLLALLGYALLYR